MLSEILDYIADKLAASEVGARLEMGDTAIARAVGESVKMKFPAPEIVAEDGSWVRLEDMVARVTPISENAFEFSLELPHSVAVSDADGQPSDRIDWRGGTMRGVWRADLETFPIFHGNFHDVVLTDLSRAEVHQDGTIETISLDQDLVELTPGLWSGPSALEVTKLEIQPAGEVETLFLDRLSLTSDIRDFDLPAWQALSTVMSANPVFNQEEFAADEQKLREAAEVFATMNAGAAKSTIALLGLQFDTPEQTLFSLQELSLNMAYDNDARPGEYSFGLTVSGLEQAEITIPPEFHPRVGTLKLHLERFPIRQILTIPLRDLDASSNAGIGKYDAVFEKIVLPLIYANRTVVEFEEVSLRAASVSLTAHGRLTAEESSMLGVVGNAEIEITGLDKLITEAARQAESGESAPEFLAMLTFAKGLGRPEINADGEVAYMFDILLSPAGEITINEIPLDLLQGSGQTSLPLAQPQHVQASVRN